jgi:hypothetical protein
LRFAQPAGDIETFEINGRRSSARPQCAPA